MLKLWSGHGAGGQTVRAAEEVERSMMLKQVRRSSERELLARKLERGALRRMRYVHWAAAQLLSNARREADASVLAEVTEKRSRARHAASQAPRSSRSENSAMSIPVKSAVARSSTTIP